MRTTDSELDIPRRILTGAGLFAARARAERAGAISLGQTAVLRQLQKAGAITPGAVADRLLTQPQSLSRTLAALEEQGWIRRRPDPDDGRQSLLEITSAGTEVLAAEMRPREIWLAGALEQLTDAERDLLVIAAGLLERLSEDRR
jgi:DNA-binding MarR family transcriptional regulator